MSFKVMKGDGMFQTALVPLMAQLYVRPKEARGDYLNSNGAYSIVMQALYDHQYAFCDNIINISWPGSVHDGRTIVNSEIFNKGETGKMFPQFHKRTNFPGRDFNLPTVILGDGSYPLTIWLLKPYSNRDSLTGAKGIQLQAQQS